MKDFLKKFSSEEYQHTDNTVITTDESNEKHKMKKTSERITKVTQKNFKPVKTKNANESGLQQDSSKADVNKNTFQTSNTHEETYVRDNEKIKKRRIKIIVGAVTCISLSIGGYLGYRQINQITVPSFIKEKSFNDVEVWAAKNKITLDSTSEFSIQADEGMIISQSIASGKRIQKGSDFKVKVSKGADPNEQLKLPDFKNMKLLEIEEWKNLNKANNLTIEKAFDDKIASGTFMSLSFKTEGVDATNYRRKDKLTITVSKGKEIFEKNIVVPDFKNKSKEDVETWANEKEVNIEYSEEANTSIQDGNVISQSISAKEKIAKNDILNIVLSRGKVSYVPNFSGLDETQATIEAAKANVAITPVQYYNNEVSASHLISQSLVAGSEIKDGDTIVLVYSLGKPYIANYDGQDLFALVESINQMNGKGANLTYQIVEISSKEPKGTILTSSAKATFVNTDSHITISVSVKYKH